MLTCRDIAAQVTNHVEHELSFGQRLRYWMHLVMCAACRRYVRQMRLTSAALRGLGEIRRETPLDETLRDAVRASRDQPPGQ